MSGTAPYALVRTTVTAHPAQPDEAAPVRTLLDRLTALTAREDALRPALCDDLFASRSGHDEEFHRHVVLPLRRALHNGRVPRPALLARLGDLPLRVPRLRAWLNLRALRDVLLSDLAAAVPGALAAERSALAGLCRSPGFNRAVALTSADLLRAVSRAARDEGGRRARKEEPSVLRHALRASTKTSPLSWFTAVGWSGGEPVRTPTPLSPPRSVVREHRTLVEALASALLDEPRRRRALPHRMTSSARHTADGRALYTRDHTFFAGGRYLVTHEEAVELAARPALTALDALAAAPAPPDELAARLGPALGRPGTDPAVGRFLGQLVDGGLLVPVAPVDPQHPYPLRALADWLRQWPEDAALSDRIERLAADTGAFAKAPAEERPALLAGLADRWRRLLADAGRPVPADAAPLNVLSEDVLFEGVLSEDVRSDGVRSEDVRSDGVRSDGVLDGHARGEHARGAGAAAGPAAGSGSLTAADRAVLGELTALAELFDLGHLMRRAALERFTARYGHGGTCPAPWEFGADTAAAWEESARLAALPSDDPGLSPGLAELAALREEFVQHVRNAAAAAPGGWAEEVVLPAEEVRGLAARLPGWTTARPLSYAWFVQSTQSARSADQGAGGLLCVNHVYGGWGRFTSRFLDDLPPGAAAEVARAIRRGLGDGARAAQIRPVGGFNANLHPLLVGEEIGPDRYHSALAEADVELVHDRESDQLRLRLRATGEPLDVLYLGFLAPVMLPQRLAPFLCDHPAGVVDFRRLLPRHTLAVPGGEVRRTPRLRHGHAVLARRRWHLPEGVVAALRADLAADPGEVPAAAAARWRALLGLPEQVFLHPVPEPSAGRPAEDFVRSLRAPKPQALDLGSALHLRCLAGWLARHPRGAVLEESLPVFGGRSRPAHAVEHVAETYRPARTPSVTRRGDTP
ncbi:lantibiotic dehydratase family protein (plasmid) [Streptomyces sp. NBC_01343]|uniref:lantibiotic dehydratase n=1 Tax=Streptomyces sp. NBC_01343 TaxID=2903832 RepID=UPI002E0F3A30|nr:lantibiotic dehydratase family protein [Streptomyces sp. NBC_01343]